MGWGILQGDSLSPLPFVLALEPLTEHLNKNRDEVRVKSGEEKLEVNHLIFIDDMKLNAYDEEGSKELYNATAAITKGIGL